MLLVPCAFAPTAEALAATNASDALCALATVNDDAVAGADDATPAAHSAAYLARLW
jgi:hypothetical protein